MAVPRKKSGNSKTQGFLSNTLSGFLNTPLIVVMNRVLYVTLLISFLVIGFLAGKLDTLEKKEVLSSSISQSAAAQPTAPIPQNVLSPSEVLEKLDVGHLPFEGNADAPVTIIEFSDFQCPFCANFFKETLPQIRSEYVATGKVKLYYRHLPLSFHPQAKPLAIASECANEQGMFWEMHDKIFENADLIATSTTETQKQWALELGLDTDLFASCIVNQTNADKIDEDIKAAGEVGSTGTPTFFVNGNKIEGAQPFAVFKNIIDTELKK